MSPLSFPQAEVTYGSLLCAPQNPREHQAYKQPSREKVKPLIEFGRSADDHHIYRIEKHGMHTVEGSDEGRNWDAKIGGEKGEDS